MPIKLLLSRKHKVTKISKSLVANPYNPSNCGYNRIANPGPAWKMSEILSRNEKYKETEGVTQYQSASEHMQGPRFDSPALWRKMLFVFSGPMIFSGSRSREVPVTSRPAWIDSEFQATQSCLSRLC